MRPPEPKDAEKTFVDLRDGKVAYSETGAGPVVVAVHGLPANSRDFRWLDSAFEEQVRFIRLDLPGCGDTPRGDTHAATPSAMGELVAEFCERLDLTDVTVLGHSMGGPVALSAAEQSERVGRLALMNSAGARFHRGIFPRTYRVILGLARVGGPVRALTIGVTKPIARAVGFSKHLKDSEMLWGARFSADYRPEETKARLTSFRKPALVLWAKDDPAIEPEVSQEIVALLPDAEEAVFDEGGHNLQAKMAVEVAEWLRGWVRAAGGTEELVAERLVCAARASHERWKKRGREGLRR